MENIGRLIWIARRPVESIVFIIAVALFGFGLYVLSPWYVEVENGLLNTTFFGQIEEYVLGTMFTLVAIPGIIGPFLKDPLSSSLLKMNTFWMFMSFLFLSVLRIIGIGWAPPHWLPVLVIALISGFIRVYLEVRKE